MMKNKLRKYMQSHFLNLSLFKRLIYRLISFVVLQFLYVKLL